MKLSKESLRFDFIIRGKCWFSLYIYIEVGYKEGFFALIKEKNVYFEG